MRNGNIAKRLPLLTTTALVALFSVSVLFSPAAYAVPNTAARDGDKVIFDDKTYEPVQSSDLPKDITDKIPDTTGYRYIDEEAKKAYFILTTGDASDASSGYYVVYTYTPPSNYSDPSPPTTVAIEASDDAAEGEEAASGCDGATLGGIGWIVCPTVNFIAKGMDKIYQIISNFLVVKTMTNDTNSSIYKLWSFIRDIANVAFVIAFIIIVYSQLTSLGISNYGLKKMLPRLIISATLVNVSFWICAIAVDASNVLGYSIHNIFTSIMDTFSVGDNYSGKIPTWEQVAAIALSGTALAAGGLFVLANTVGGTIFLLIPFLLGVVVAALVALIVLAARQALITILVILAPLAFVAYILPNTEKYFTKWRQTMMTMLLLFPIFSVLFSGAQVAGMAIVQSAGGNLFTIILGMAVQVAPIVITPLLVKFSGGLIGKIAGMVNNPSKGLLDRNRNWAKAKMNEKKNKVLADQNKYFRRNPMHRATKAIDTRRRRVEGTRKAYEAMADNRFADTDQGRNVEALNRSASNEKQRIDNVFNNSARGRQLELQSRHLNADKQQIDNAITGSTAGQQVTYRQHMLDVDKTRIGNEFEQTHLGHQAEHAKRTVEMEKKIIENNDQAEWDEQLRTDANLNHLELTLKNSEVRANLQKGKLDKMHAELSAIGNLDEITDSAERDKKEKVLLEHVQNLRGGTQEVNDGVLRIARNIHDVQVETSVTGSAKQSADHELSSTINKALLNNSVTIDGKEIRTYAAGLGREENVLAQSVATQRKEFGEQVSYQKQLADHFKLSAYQVGQLSQGIQDVEGKDAAGNTHVFKVESDYVRDMAAEHIFKVGSHDDIMKVIMTSGEGGINYEYRRTIMDAAIQSGFAKKNPAIADKTLDMINNGEFKGEESWQFHALREVLEGRINSSALATAHASSLKKLFVDVNTDAMAREQFEKLIQENVERKVKDNPGLSPDEARKQLIDTFNTKRENMRKMAAGVLSNSTVSQGTSDESVGILREFSSQHPNNGGQSNSRGNSGNGGGNRHRNNRRGGGGNRPRS